MIKNIDVRFFIYATDYDNDNQTEIYEVTERCFLSRKDERSKISYERHSVFNNGVSQICLTLEPSITLEPDEIEIITGGNK